MNAELDGLAEFLRTNLEGGQAEVGTTCPASEDLVRIVTGEAGRKERKRVLDHVAGCGECAKLLKSLLRISDEFDRLAGETGPRRKPRLVPGRRAAFTALAGLAGLALVTLAVIRLAERPVVRGTSGLEVRLVSPKAGAVLAVTDIEFRWAAVPKAAGYRVELFDKSLARLWRSGSLSDVRMELPAEARSVLSEGQTYFWRVTASLDDGREVPSKLAEFSTGQKAPAQSP
jgi:hypothetical protein